MIQANKVSYKTSNGDTTDVNSALDRLFDLNTVNEKIGSTDISSIGDGTITGAISNLNGSISNINGSISNLTGSISNINGSISNLNGAISNLNTSLNYNTNMVAVDTTGQTSHSVTLTNFAGRPYSAWLTVGAITNGAIGWNGSLYYIVFGTDSSIQVHAIYESDSFKLTSYSWDYNTRVFTFETNSKSRYMLTR
jgi:hypothetical protein